MKPQNDAGLKMLRLLFLLSLSYVCYGGGYLSGQPRLSGGLSFVERCYPERRVVVDSRLGAGVPGLVYLSVLVYYNRTSRVRGNQVHPLLERQRN